MTTNHHQESPWPEMIVLPDNLEICRDQDGWLLDIHLPMVAEDIITTIERLYLALPSWLPRRCRLAGLPAASPDQIYQFRYIYEIY
jgi:hypothetical protein